MKEQTKTSKDKLKDYDILECPYCNLKCKPVKENNDGSVSYQKHDCDHGEYSFKIDKDGDLSE